MIKFKGYDSKKKRTFLGFGLSEENIGRLKEKQPIYINGNDLNVVIDFLIFYGKTEEEMHNDLKKFISSQTKIHGVDEQE